jgi:hypothetical protein
MTVIARITTIERDNAISNFIAHALVELKSAIKRQTDLTAAQGIDRAMTALERAQTTLAQ